tara:strand:+ start:566 stop:1246 length:681 start_codon:yes stop_codon:yes gene_type:complete
MDKIMTNNLKILAQSKANIKKMDDAIDDAIKEQKIQKIIDLNGNEVYGKEKETGVPSFETARNMELEAQKDAVENKRRELTIIEKRIETGAELIRKRVLSGDVTPSMGLFKLKAMQKIIANAIEVISDQAIAELDEDHMGSVVFDGYRLEVVEGGKYYDYSNCEEVQEITEKLKEAKGKYKAAVEGLNKRTTIQGDEPGTFIDSDGQICNLPEIKQRRRHLKLTKV